MTNIEFVVKLSPRIQAKIYRKFPSDTKKILFNLILKVKNCFIRDKNEAHRSVIHL